MTLPNYVPEISPNNLFMSHPLFPHVLRVLLDPLEKDPGGNGDYYLELAHSHRAAAGIVPTMVLGEDPHLDDVVLKCLKLAYFLQKEFSNTYAEEKDFHEKFGELIARDDFWEITEDTTEGKPDNGKANNPRKRKFIDAITTIHTNCAEKESQKQKRKLDPAGCDILLEWFLGHLDNPYPTPAERQQLIQATGFTPTQFRNWFTNHRKRHWAPMKKGHQPRTFVDHFIVKSQRKKDDEKTLLSR